MARFRFWPSDILSLATRHLSHRHCSFVFIHIPAWNVGILQHASHCSRKVLGLGVRLLTPDSRLLTPDT